MLNINYLLRRFSGRATCIKDSTVKLLQTARIINFSGANQSIVIGANSVIRGELLVLAHGGQINIGKWCYVGEGSRLWSGKSLFVGDRVMISHNVNIFDNQTHPMQPDARHQHFRHIMEKGHPKDINLGDEPVTIEDDVWIAAGATILRGVTIGHGSIVAAAAVVTRDVPPMTIVVGNPAREAGTVNI